MLGTNFVCSRGARRLGGYIALAMNKIMARSAYLRARTRRAQKKKLFSLLFIYLFIYTFASLLIYICNSLLNLLFIIIQICNYGKI